MRHVLGGYRIGRVSARACSLQRGTPGLRVRAHAPVLEKQSADAAGEIESSKLLRPSGIELYVLELKRIALCRLS
jgi:hypothetical protein